MAVDSKLPHGRLGRLALLATVGARTGLSLLLSKQGEGAAQHTAAVLGNLRGLAAKIGQMASYIDGVVPEEHREAYERALGSLRDATPCSSWTSMRQVIEAELGAPLDELFASIDETPMASASIGQVHRATLDDGREVAVKVQHEDIAKAIESDLSNANVIEALVSGATGGKLDSKRVFEEIKQRFREELDYELEAAHQRRFSALHAGDPLIHIPEVVSERSARRVITTELVHGALLEEAARAPEALRRSYAEGLWRFVFKSNLVGGLFNADPHPGNYLFRPDGGIHYLDFGCVQPIEGARLERARALHRAALAGDRDGFGREVRLLLETRGGDYERLAIDYTERCFEPVFVSPFHMTRRWVTELVEGVLAMKQTVLTNDGGFVPLPPGMVFLNRLQFGFYSVLARLDVEADYARVEREFLGAAGLL